MVHITIGSGKMEQINSINTNSLSNPWCIKMSKVEGSICSKCYANRLLAYRKSLESKLEFNSILLSETVLPMKDLPRINALYFRFNSFGELINDNHLANLLNICRANPRTTFTLWSKRIGMIRGIQDKPKNLILIYSNPNLNRRLDVPKGFDKVFSVFNAKYIRENSLEVNCKKECMTCLKCYTFNNITEIREGLK